MVNMSFNLGVPGLLKFKNSLNYLKKGDYQLAAANFTKSKWYEQVGNRARRIVSDIYSTNPPVLDEVTDKTIPNITLSSVKQQTKLEAGKKGSNNHNRGSNTKNTLNGGKDPKLPNMTNVTATATVEHKNIAKASHEAIRDVHNTLKESYDVQTRMLSTLEDIAKNLPNVKPTGFAKVDQDEAKANMDQVNNILNSTNTQFSNPAINLKRTTVKAI